MKKKLFLLTFAALAIVSFISKNNSLQSKSVILASNIEAIAGDEDDDPDFWIRMKQYSCYEANGSWNMATILKDQGFFEETKCKVTGQLSVAGVTISGSFEKGKKYTLPWASYTCTQSDQNCCKKVGLYTGETKLA
mgnify:CR=1 FL=1|jgi:hypothetical protein